MPPHHPSVQGHEAIVQCFRSLFSRGRFAFTFTSSHVHIAGDAYSNFCRVHRSLRVTPAIKANLTDHVWSIPELLTAA